MKRKLLILIILLLNCVALVKAQTQYRSAGGGVSVDLSSAANWQSSTNGGTTWITATAAPTNVANANIFIQAGDTWNNQPSTASTAINATTNLTDYSSLTGTFLNGTTYRLTVNGTLTYAGTAPQVLPAAGCFSSSAVTNLTINNPTTVSTSSNTITVKGILNLMQGTFNANAGSAALSVGGTIAANGGLLNVSTGAFSAVTSTNLNIPAGVLYQKTIGKFDNTASATSVTTNEALTIGSYLQLPNGTGSIILGGPLTIQASSLVNTTSTGGINAGSNTVTFDGTTLQAVQAANFFTSNSISNLAISNAAGVTYPASLTIGSSLTVNNLGSTTPLTVAGTATIGGNLTIGSFGTNLVPGAPITILSATSLNGTFSSVSLPSGYSGTISYTATAVVLSPSTNASLSNLVLSSGALTPVFASATSSYSVSVPNATASVTVTPTAADGSATITVNGTAVASGTASGTIALNTGPNTITTVVTALDGTTTKTYTINITRAPIDATLSALAISSGTLSPAFAGGTSSYAASVTNASITVTPTTNDPAATVTVNGTAVTSGSASAAIPLSYGSNTITMIVTAQDGVTTQTYTLTVTRLLSSDATLSNLTLSNGTLSPVFAGATNSYTASTLNGSITITPTTNDPAATLTLNGSIVTSGSASATIALNYGSNTITTVVTAQDGITTKTYTVTVTRLLSSDATLSNLSLSSGTLSPAFASGTNTYTASVSNATSSITVTPTTNNATATVKVNGTTVISGNVSTAIDLVMGSNTITAVVTAQDGVTTQTYTLTVTRLPSSDASLANLTLSSGTLSPVFAAGTSSYTASVNNTASTITIAPTSGDPNAMIKVNGTVVASGSPSGNIALAVGANTITTIVTALDGVTTQTYTVTVTRQLSSNANLAGLTISTGTLSPVFASATNNYTVSVPSATASVTVTPTVSDANATIMVNGTAVTSGSASLAQGLIVGTNNISIIVKAPDGTLNTYTVVVTRLAIAQTITFGPLSAVNYGAADITPTATSTNSTIPITYSSSNTAVATITTSGNIHIIGAGTTTITASQSGNAAYIAATPVNQSLTVNPAVLNITAANTSKVYGAANPTFTATYAGFVNGDSQASLTTAPTLTTTATTASVTGIYPITASGAAANNYTITYLPGTLTITPASRVFTFSAIPGTHTYGDADFSIGATINTGETIVYTTSDATIATIVNGMLHIVSAGTVSVTASVASNPNYANVQPLSQSLTINRAAQTVTFSGLPILQVGQPVVTLSLTSSVGLPVTFTSSDATIIAASGQNITPVGLGSAYVIATQVGSIDYLPASVSVLVKVQDMNEVVKVKPGLSPNGDGINDVLIIEGIEDYPQNKITIVNRNGLKVFQISGYDNVNKVFNGHSNSGDLLQAGTYFYELEINTQGETIKRKAGYIVLKFN